jgi:hypothetical protein
VREPQTQCDYKHESGEIYKVQKEQAGLGIRKVRIPNLPPEVPDRVIIRALAKYGEVKDITEDKWSRAYRYPISNGIKFVTQPT